MLSELKALYDLIDQLAEKRKTNSEQKDLDKFLVAIYKLGNDGNDSVSAEELEAEGDFSKQHILTASRAALSQNLVLNAKTFGRPLAWKLSVEGEYYVSGLLELENNN